MIIYYFLPNEAETWKMVAFGNVCNQDLLKLERLQWELSERNGGKPTIAQWAAAAGVDQRTLRKRLSYGRFCKDKMIKSNIRLVISIAKNYQNAGLSLQDLVQVIQKHQTSLIPTSVAA